MQQGDASSGKYVPLATEDPEALLKNGVEEDESIELVLHDPLPHHSSDSLFSFVEASWFQIVSACVIIFNTITVFLEADDDTWKRTFFVPDQSTLCFYIFELICRMCFFGKHFLDRRLLFWNALDLVVVTAGVTDQWVLRFCPIDADSPLFSVILMFRLLRLVRVAKIVRIFLDTDLQWTEKPGFQSFIGGVIAFNALLMGFETDIQWIGWFYIEQGLLAIYVFELTVRLKRSGIEFIYCDNPDIVWNILDFTIVVCSAADSWVLPGMKILAKQFTSASGEANNGSKGINLSQFMMLLRMLRLMRILRLVKLVKSVRPLYVLVTCVLSAVQGVVWVLVLTIVTLYAAGILSTRLLGHGLLFPHGKAPESATVFKTVPDSMFILFRVMSGAQSDEEAAALDELMAALPSVKFAFIFFMVTSSWTLLSILTAVVSDNMISTTRQQSEEFKIASDEEDRAAHKIELRQLFEQIAKNGDGRHINEQDISVFLKEKDNALKTAKVCRVAPRNLLAVLNDLNNEVDDGTPVEMDRFVESMLDVAKPFTEQNIMKIETLFTDLQAKVDEGCKALASKVERSRQHRSSERSSVRSLSSGSSCERQLQTKIQTLAMQQKKHSEGINKLNTMLDALLKGQDALSQQRFLQPRLLAENGHCRDVSDQVLAKS